MQDPLLTAGVFDAAFGLIVFVVSVLAAFALWRSGTRDPRPWKVLLIVVAVVLAVSSLVAGIAALPRAVEAIDSYRQTTRDHETTERITEALYSGVFSGEIPTLAPANELQERSLSFLNTNAEPATVSAVMMSLAGLDEGGRDALLAQIMDYWNRTDMTQAGAEQNFVIWQYQQAVSRQQFEYSTRGVWGAFAELATQPFRATSAIGRNIWAQAASPQDAWYRSHLSLGQNLSTSLGQEAGSGQAQLASGIFDGVQYGDITVEQSVVELMYLEYPDLREVAHPTDMLLVADTVCAVAGDFERPERLLDYLGYVRDELNDPELFAATLAATAAISKAPESFCAPNRIQRVVLAAQALIDAEGVDAALAAAQVVAGVTTTTTRPSPGGIFPGTGAPKLSDAETVWCNTAEGHSATFLAGDALGLLEVAGNGSPHKLTPTQRQALTSVVETGKTGLTGNQHEEFVEQMRNVRLGWHFARACQAAFASR